MRQRLGEITGVGAMQQNAAPVKPRFTGGRAPASSSKPSLVRSAIVRLLHVPALALTLEPPYGFSELRQPGVSLLIELLEIVRSRPDITTGALLEHFAEREELGALQKLAMQVIAGEESSWIQELHGAIEQLEDQAIQQRIVELQAKMSAGTLDVADKYELTTLLQAQRRRGQKPA
jgi:DNA primase